MKVVLILLSMLFLSVAIGLAIGWDADHRQFAIVKKKLLEQLAAEKVETDNAQKKYEDLRAQQADAKIELKSQLDKSTQKLAAEDNLIGKIKDDQAQLQRTIAADQDRYDALQKSYQIALADSKHNYDEVARWNKLVIEKQRELNELLAYANRFHSTNTATQGELGMSLYSEAMISPSSYAITGNGQFWMPAQTSGQAK